MQIKYIDKSGRYNATGVAEQYFNKLKENGFEPTYTGELWGVDYLGDIYIYVKGDIYVEVDVFNNINDFNGIIVHLSSGDFAARAYNWMP